MTSNYQPITCAQHDRLELTALKRQWLELNVMTGDCVGWQRVLPLDVYTGSAHETEKIVR